MTEHNQSEIEQLVTGLCNRYSEATPETVRDRVTTLREEHNVSIGTVLEVIGATFGDEPLNVRTIESVKTARFEPIEATLVGVVLTVLNRPERNARVLWVTDGTDRIRVVLPASAISMDASGAVREFSRLGIKKKTSLSDGCMAACVPRWGR